MRLRAAALLFALALAACATKPPPPPVAPTQAEWDAVSSPDFTCAPGQFVDADFQIVLSTPSKYDEMCVRIRGLLAPQTLTKNAVSAAAIGVYAKDQKILAGVSSHSQFAFVSGRLRSCAGRAAKLQALTARATQAGATPPPSPLIGFCRINAGPALFVNRVELSPTAMD